MLIDGKLYGYRRYAMKEVALGFIENKLCEVVADLVAKKFDQFYERKNKGEIREKIEKELSTFLIKNNEPIFDTSAFLRYLEFQNPIGKIIDYVSNTNRNPTDVSESEFINQLTEDCEGYLNEAGGSCSVYERGKIKELFSNILKICKELMLSITSSEGNALSYQMREYFCAGKADRENLTAGIDEIRTFLATTKIINDHTVAGDIYELLSKAIFDGAYREVFNILQVLHDKNSSIENGIKIQLSIFTDYVNCSDDEIYSLYNKITVNSIKEAIYKLLVMKYFAAPSKLRRYIGSVKNKVLDKIVNAIEEGTAKNLFVREQKSKVGLKLYDISVPEWMNDEQWLATRLMVLQLRDEGILGSHEVIEKYTQNPNIFDQLFVWESYFERQNLDGSKSLKDDPKARQYIATMKSAHALERYARVALEFKDIFYYTLLYALKLTADHDYETILSNISEPLADTEKVSALIMQEKINNGDIDKDSLIDYVVRTKRYGMLILFLEKLTDDNSRYELLCSIKWLVSKDFRLFNYSVRQVKQSKGNKEALQWMEENKDKFHTFAEYWILKYEVSESKEQKMSIASLLASKIEEEKVEFYSIGSCMLLADLFFVEQKNDPAFKIVETLEEIGIIDKKLLYNKICALINMGKSIEALEEIYQHYDLFKDNSIILKSLLSISLVHHRCIEESVLNDLNQNDDPEIMLMVAKYEQRRGNESKALQIAMKAILSSDQEDDTLLSNAAGIFWNPEFISNKEVTEISEDTFFVLQNIETEGYISICVYKDHILPEENMNWGGALHIYKENVIYVTCMRYRVGDKVTINDADYEIIEIASVEAFFARKCMDAMIKYGKAIAITANTAEEMLKNIVKMEKEHPEWGRFDFDRAYKDFTQIPPPLHTIKSHFTLEYAEMVRLMMDDPSVIIRERVCQLNNEDCERKFVLTYSALAMLEKLGLNFENFPTNAIIPLSVISEAERENEVIYKANDRELVASLSIEKEKLQINKKDDDTKRKMIMEANKFLISVRKLSGIPNKHNLESANINSDELIKAVGICDYDAITLAKENNATVVSGELILTLFCQTEEINVQVCSIADFLCFCDLKITDVFLLVKTMMQYRFYAPLTPKLINYTISIYDQSDPEVQDTIMSEWDKILIFPVSLNDGNYLEKIKDLCLDIVDKYRNLDEERLHPIFQMFILATMHYNGLKLQYTLQNGKYEFELVNCDD